MAPTSQHVHSPLAVLAIHERDKATVPPPGPLFFSARPHDLDAGQRPVLAKHLTQLCFRHLGKGPKALGGCCVVSVQVHTYKFSRILAPTLQTLL